VGKSFCRQVPDEIEVSQLERQNISHALRNTVHAPDQRITSTARRLEMQCTEIYSVQRCQENMLLAMTPTAALRGKALNVRMSRAYIATCSSRLRGRMLAIPLMSILWGRRSSWMESRRGHCSRRCPENGPCRQGSTADLAADAG
jgi:hypothetical protein